MSHVRRLQQHLCFQGRRCRFTVICNTDHGVSMVIVICNMDHGVLMEDQEMVDFIRAI